MVESLKSSLFVQQLESSQVISCNDSTRVSPTLDCIKNTAANLQVFLIEFAKNLQVEFFIFNFMSLSGVIFIEFTLSPSSFYRV